MKKKTEHLERQLRELQQENQAKNRELDRRARILDAVQDLGWKWARSQDPQERNKGEKLRDTIDHNA